MKSFRQYISEAGIRRKMRVQKAIRKKLRKQERAAREGKPGAPTDEQLERTWEESDAADLGVERAQQQRHPRVVRKSVELADPGDSPEKHLENAQEIARQIEDGDEVPEPYRRGVNYRKDKIALAKSLGLLRKKK
jgi:hypothetical protein